MDVPFMTEHSRGAYAAVLLVVSFCVNCRPQQKAALRMRSERSSNVGIQIEALRLFSNIIVVGSPLGLLSSPAMDSWPNLHSQ